MIFSERKMRLDFQHSLERDSYYHRFQDVARKMKDYEDELGIVEEEADQRVDETVEKRKRTLKMKRVLSLEANKFFNSVIDFTGELVDDIKVDGLKCLNGHETVLFDDIEGKRFLEGKTLREALQSIREFSIEVRDLLNVPDFYVQE